MAARKKQRKWSRKVKTESTFPPAGTFKKNAESVAKTMASKAVSPKGIGSGIKMVQMFINRAGKKLPKGQKKELEKAKHILQEKKSKEQGGATRKKRRKSVVKG